MSEPTKTLVPNYRFPEFQDTKEWTEIKLIDTANKKIKWSFIGGPFGSNLKSSDYVKNGIRVIQLQNIGDAEFIDDYRIFTSEEKANELLSNNIYPDEIILSKMGDPVGRACLMPKTHNRYVMCSDGIRLVVDERSHSKYFIYSLINSSQFRALVEKTATGSTRKRIGLDDLKTLPMAVPQREEQQKIADCLSSIDELITAQTKKIAALKNHKKGLMQQLFPAEGETVPQLRFAEFQDAGEWEMKEVGKVFEVTRGYVLSMGLVKATESEETPFPVYSSQTKNNGLAGFYNDYLYESAITWTTDGANAGDVNYRHGKFYCTNVCGVLINNDGFANLCTAALLNSVSKKYVSYVGNPKLMNGVMSKIEIPFPSVPEQQKISDCLSSIDELITAQIQKLEALKTHKNGLMQQLFPNADEVNE